MPFWVQGCVEVCTGEPDRDAIWTEVIDLSPLIDSGDAASERLFGLSKAFRSSDSNSIDALFANRGLPENPCTRVKSDFAANQQFPGECGGYTFATLAEINGSRFDIREYPRSDWNVVFRMLQQLNADGRFGPHSIRLVAWFNW